MNDNLKVKLKNIKALFFDVDGTLTDGRIIYDAAGNELKSFFARDGSRITLALKAGLSIYFITSRVSESVKRRAEDRKINGVLSKNDFPGASFADFFNTIGVTAEEVLYLGDDINDIPFMQCVGLKVAVADAAAEVIACADIITNAPGGYGAVAE